MGMKKDENYEFEFSYITTSRVCIKTDMVTARKIYAGFKKASLWYKNLSPISCRKPVKCTHSVPPRIDISSKDVESEGDLRKVIDRLTQK